MSKAQLAGGQRQYPAVWVSRCCCPRCGEMTGLKRLRTSRHRGGLRIRAMFCTNCKTRFRAVLANSPDYSGDEKPPDFTMAGPRPIPRWADLPRVR